MLTVLVLSAALALVFFYAPDDADQGFVQRIFYIHVPLAIVALGGFVVGAAMAVAHLRTRDPRWDMRSYVAIHLALVLAVGVLLPGSMRLTFLVSLAGIALLYATLWKYEMTSKYASAQLRALRRKLGAPDATARRSAAPALPPAAQGTV